LELCTVADLHAVLVHHFITASKQKILFFYEILFFQFTHPDFLEGNIFVRWDIKE
jgi:hypothetical protein